MANTLPKRRSTRLPEYDYATPGAYFITIVTADRIFHFGTIVNCQMQLNWLGEMVKTEWQSLSLRFPGWEVGSFIVMPNHVHGLLILNGSFPSKNQKSFASIGTIIRTFKSSTTIRYTRTRNSVPGSLWQRGYHDHIVRSQRELEQIDAYILNNPIQWEQDRENPGGASM